MRIWQFVLVVFNFNFFTESKFTGAHYDMLLKHGMEKCKTNPSSIACPAFILASFLDYQKFSQAQVRCHFLCSMNSSDKNTYMRWYNVKQRFLAYYEDSDNIDSCIQKHYGGKYPLMSIENMLLYLNTPLKSIHRYFYEIGRANDASVLLSTYLGSNPDNEEAWADLELYNSELSYKDPLDLDEKLYKVIFDEIEDSKTIEKSTDIVNKIEIGIKNLFLSINKCVLHCESYYSKCRNEQSSSQIFKCLRDINACQKICVNKQEKQYLLEYLTILQRLIKKTSDTKMQCEIEASLQKFGVKSEASSENLNCKMRNDVYSYLSLIIQINEFSVMIDEMEKKNELPKQKLEPKQTCKEVNALPLFACDSCYEKSDAFHKTNYYEHLLNDLLQHQNSIESHYLMSDSVERPKIIADEKQLNGTNRVLAENLLNNKQCLRLIALAENAATLGDGYTGGKMNPLSENEYILGLNSNNAGKLLISKIVTPDSIKLFYDKLMEATDFVKKQFCLNEELYIAFSHLICRYEAPGSKNRENDILSHPIHSDNCILKCPKLYSNAKPADSCKCVEEFPAYTNRNFSALLYLNSEDFSGGEFFFADYKTGSKTLVKPKCGRLVAFQNKGLDNIHGVTGVSGKGKRCALAMWFTLDNFSRDENLYALKDLLKQF